MDTKRPDPAQYPVAARIYDLMHALLTEKDSMEAQRNRAEAMYTDLRARHAWLCENFERIVTIDGRPHFAVSIHPLKLHHYASLDQLIDTELPATTFGDGSTLHETRKTSTTDEVLTAEIPISSHREEEKT